MFEIQCSLYAKLSHIYNHFLLLCSIPYIQQIFFEHLLCAKHYFSHGDATKPWCLHSGEERIGVKIHDNIYIHTYEIYQVGVGTMKNNVVAKRDGDGLQKALFNESSL